MELSTVERELDPDNLQVAHRSLHYSHEAATLTLRHMK